MLQGDIDRLDDATAAAGRFDFAYQPPPLAPDRQPPATTEMLPMPLGNPLPEGPLGLELPPAGVVPSDSVAWQNAIEQLLRLIGPDQQAVLREAPARGRRPAGGAPTVIRRP